MIAIASVDKVIKYHKHVVAAAQRLGPIKGPIVGAEDSGYLAILKVEL